MTKIRKEILEIIKCSSKPLLIKEIIDQLRIKVDLSSVYRTLKFLFDSRKIYIFSFKNRKYYFSNQKGESGHFLICKSCNEIKCFDNCIAESLQRKLQCDFNFHITEHILYFEGYCSECQKYIEKKRKYDQ